MTRTPLIGSGTVLWKARELHAAGEIDDNGLTEMVTQRHPVGRDTCNTMGTASTMNRLSQKRWEWHYQVAQPSQLRTKKGARCAYRTGLQIVEMVHADRKPSDIMTREAFENAIVTNTCHWRKHECTYPSLRCCETHIGVQLDLNDWDQIGIQITTTCQYATCWPRY